MKQLERREKYQPKAQEREYLTIEELRRLMNEPCSNEQVKKAFIFSCFAGLRLSDVRTLTWRNVLKSSDGKTVYVHVFMQKTQKSNNVPLSNEALACLIKKENLDEPIFVLPASDATINYHLKRWVKAAGIDKTISFHVARHTFATMTLTAGGDLYTTSRLLGHTNIHSTEIYADVVMERRTQAVNLLNAIF